MNSSLSQIVCQLTVSGVLQRMSMLIRRQNAAIAHAGQRALPACDKSCSSNAKFCLSRLIKRTSFVSACSAGQQAHAAGVR